MGETMALLRDALLNVRFHFTLQNAWPVSGKQRSSYFSAEEIMFTQAPISENTVKFCVARDFPPQPQVQL